MLLKRHFLIGKKLFLLVNCLRGQKLNFQKLTSRNRNQSKNAAKDVELKSRVLNFSFHIKFGQKSSNLALWHGSSKENEKIAQNSISSNLVSCTVSRVKKPREIDLRHQNGIWRLLICLLGHFDIDLAKFIGNLYIIPFKNEL